MTRSRIGLFVLVLGLFGLSYIYSRMMGPRVVPPVIDWYNMPPKSNSLTMADREASHAIIAPDPRLPERVVAQLIREPYSGRVVSVSFSPNGHYLAAHTRDGGVDLWDVATWRLIRTIPKINHCSLAFSPDSSLLAAPRGKDLVLHSVPDGRPLRAYPLERRPVNIRYAADGQRVYFSFQSAPLWTSLDLKSATSKPLFDETAIKAATKTSQVVFTEPTMTVGIALNGETPVMFNARTNRPGLILPKKMTGTPTAVLSPDRAVLVTMGQEGLQFFRVPGGEPIPGPTTSSASQCRFTPDGKRVAYLSEFGSSVRLFDRVTGKFAAPLAADPILTCLSFSPDGQNLATGCEDGSLLIWRVGGERPVVYAYDDERTADEHQSPVPNHESNKTPLGAVASLRTNKAHYIFGEEIELTLEIRNMGRRPFSVFRGCDYRGATRHLNFLVTATHEDGSEMPDPHPNQNCLGGLGGSSVIEPGKFHSDNLKLLDYRRLTKPGRYLVTATHEWNLVGSATIEVRDPTPAEARQLWDDLNQKMPKQPNHHPDHKVPAFGRLTHPVYLPLLREGARAGSKTALMALGQMPDPEATKTLVELLDHQDAKFVAAVEEELYLRLPDPELDGQVHRRNIFESDDSDPRKYLRDASWRPEFAAAVRAHARKNLATADRTDRDRGAFMLCCVGTPEDWPALRKALDTALTANQGKPMADDDYPRPSIDCEEMRRAVQMLVVRGVVAPVGPTTGADRILFVEAINRRPDFRPPGWEVTYTAALRDPLPYVRRVAIDCLPEPLPEFARKLIPSLLADAHVDVQVAACRVAYTVKAPEWKSAVMKTLAEAQNSWLINAAGNAAYGLCTPLEHMEIYVNKLTDPKAAAESLSALKMIFRDSFSSSIGNHLKTPEQREACQAAWRRFIAEHREKLAKPQPFSLLDPIPLKELFPGYRFDRSRQ